jgi:hypothetical protein
MVPMARKAACSGCERTANVGYPISADEAVERIGPFIGSTAGDSSEIRHRQ